MKTKKNHVHVANEVTKKQSDSSRAEDVYNNMSFDDYFDMSLHEYSRFMSILVNHKHDYTD